METGPPGTPEDLFSLSEKPRSLLPPERRKKIRSFSQATCAAEKILLGLQTCALPVKGGQRVRCSQAANPLVKKYYFLTVLKTSPGYPGGRFDCFVHYSMHSMVQACSRVAVPYGWKLPSGMPLMTPARCSVCTAI